MRSLYIIAGFLTATLSLSAQAIRVPAGKKFSLLIENNTTTNMSMMGQEVLMSIGSNITQECSVQKISTTGYTLTATTKRISGSVSMLGQDQKFDSDDQATKDNPEMAELFKQINNQQELKVENGKIITSPVDSSSALAALGMNMNNLLDVTKLFLTVSAEQLKQGYSWADSSITEGSKIVNQYLVTSLANHQAEIRVSTDTKLNTTIKQAGMEMKQNMKGFSTATRLYDLSNGLLISEKLALEMAGTAEVMGISAPMTVKTGINITVKQ